MTNKLLNLFFSFFIYSISFCQTQQVCYVKYKNLKDPFYDYVHWFDSSSSNYIIQKDFRYINGFPVYVNGVSRNETDTIKYNQEYHDFVENYKNVEKEKPLVVTNRLYQSNLSFFSKKLGNIEYVVVDTLPTMSDWEILQDTCNVLNFKCQKAVTTFKSTKYFAYFTQSLPFPSGPKNFRGLPGLILKVELSDGKPLYVASELIYPYKMSIPQINRNGISITQSEFSKLIAIENSKTFENMKSFETIKKQ